jgi:hypothetical protein
LQTATFIHARKSGVKLGDVLLDYQFPRVFGPRIWLRVYRYVLNCVYNFLKTKPALNCVSQILRLSFGSPRDGALKSDWSPSSRRIYRISSCRRTDCTALRTDKAG